VLSVNLRGFIVMSLDMADCAQIYIVLAADNSVHTCEIVNL